MSILVLGPAEEEQISLAVRVARAMPIPFEVLKAVANQKTDVLLLGDRKMGVDEVRMKYPPQNVVLGTYRCAISFEEQKDGLMRHISISTRKGKIPGLEVLAMVLPAFGFSGFPLVRPGNAWIEEFEPGWFAVNVIELAD